MSKKYKVSCTTLGKLLDTHTVICEEFCLLYHAPHHCRGTHPFVVLCRAVCAPLHFNTTNLVVPISFALGLLAVEVPLPDPFRCLQDCLSPLPLPFLPIVLSKIYTSNTSFGVR